MEKTWAFLKAIKKNNNREWFTKHKDEFQDSQKEFKEFVKKVVLAMQTHDEIDETGTKVYRIYKDVRFSKDKTPYKTSWSANIKRAGADRRGGYYLQLEPDNTFLAGGFFGPNPQDLLHIRRQIEQDADLLRESIEDENYKAYFGDLQGEQVKSAPKGFSKDAENIDLIRFKQFYFRHDFTDDEVLSPDFATEISEGFKVLRPFFNAMTEMLTTDLNGLPINS